MIIHELLLSEGELRKLFGVANSDAALLYLYIKAGNSVQSAAAELKLNESRMSFACSTLQQLGFLPEDKPTRVLPSEPPVYSEQDVIDAMERDESFASLCHAVEQLFGRKLNAEDRKRLLSLVRYLGLPADVVYTLIHYCRDQRRQRGISGNPGLCSIEKEAYVWWDNKINTMEAASAYIHAQNLRATRLHRLKERLQIRGRELTGAEEAYAVSWLEMGFDDDAIAMAYERTCLKTGGLNWKYMNGIMKKWHEAGLHTVQQIRSGDTRPRLPDGATGQLGEEEKEAIRALVRNGEG